MNMLSRCFFIACFLSATVYASCITVSTSSIALGEDPKTHKNLTATAYSFTDNSAKGDESARLLSVFSYEKELVFFTTKNNLADIFPIAHIVSSKQNFKVYIDPASPNFILQELKDSANNQSIVTLEVRIDPQVQVFKELLILIAQGDIKNLESFANKHSLTEINEIIDRALDCQGNCYIECDNKEAFDAILQKQYANQEQTLTGKYTFIPLQIIQEALKEFAKNSPEDSESLLN